MRSRVRGLSIGAVLASSALLTSALLVAPQATLVAEAAVDGSVSMDTTSTDGDVNSVDGDDRGSSSSLGEGGSSDVPQSTDSPDGTASNPDGSNDGSDDTTDDAATSQSDDGESAAGAARSARGAAPRSSGGVIYVDSPFQTATNDINGVDWFATGTLGESQNVKTIPVSETNSIGDKDGNGDGRNTRWVTLTDDNTNGGWGSSGFMLSTKPFDSNLGVVMEYDQRIWRNQNGRSDKGGDGLSVFLVDANIEKSTESGGSGNGINIDTNPEQTGGYGAGLGYTSAAGMDKSLRDHPQQGVAGGWMGIGFDVYGNYANYSTDMSATTGRTRPQFYKNAPDWTPALPNGSVAQETRAPNTIGLRGSGVRHKESVPYLDDHPSAYNYWYGMNAGQRSDTGGEKWHGGYKWLAGQKPTNGNIENDFKDASKYRKIRVSITPVTDGHQIDVYMSDPLDVNSDLCVSPANWNGDFASCLQWQADPTQVSYVKAFSYTMDEDSSPYQANIPDQFRIGFGASTGWAVDYHQIRNVRVTALADPAVVKQIASIDSNGAVQSPTKGSGCDTGNFCEKVETTAGSHVEYKIQLSNAGPTNLEEKFPVLLSDGLSDLPLTNISWCAYASDSGKFAYKQGGTWAWLNAKDRPSTYCDTSENWVSVSEELPEFAWVANKKTTNQVTVSIRGKVTAQAVSGTWTNTAVISPDVSGGPQDTNLANNRDSAAFYVPPAPVWEVKKSSIPESGGTVAAGSNIGYTVTATSNDSANQGLTTTTVYFQRPVGWGGSDAYMHYCRKLSDTADNCTWTKDPGAKMSASTNSSYPSTERWFEITLEGKQPLTAAFNNGSGTWDNNNYNNFQIGDPTNKDSGAGSWTVQGSTVKQLANPTPEVINVNNAYIVDDLSAVSVYADFRTSNPAPELEVGGMPVILPSATACPSDPTTASAVCYTPPTGDNGYQLTVGGFSIPAGQTAELKYTVKVKNPVAPGKTFKNLALGSAANGAPTQCAVGSHTLTDETISEPCSTNHNTAAGKLTLLKMAEGGLKASDFKLTATAPTGTDLPWLDAVTGSETPSDENSVLVLPGATYQVSEAGKANTPAFLQKGLQKYKVSECTIDALQINWRNAGCWDDIDFKPGVPTDVKLKAGERGIYRFVNIAPVSPQLPLTGGISRDAFLIAGLLVLVAGAGATAVVQRNKRRKGVA